MPRATNVELIAVADIRPYCSGEMDPEARLRRAFRRAREFWLSGDDDLRFRAALAAAMVECRDEADKERIERSARLLAAASAAIGGLPVDLEPEAGFVPLPLVRFWLEAK